MIGESACCGTLDGSAHRSTCGKQKVASSDNSDLLTLKGEPVTQVMLRELWEIIKTDCSSNFTCQSEHHIAAARRLVSYGKS